MSAPSVPQMCHLIPKVTPDYIPDGDTSNDDNDPNPGDASPGKPISTHAHPCAQGYFRVTCLIRI